MTFCACRTMCVKERCHLKPKKAHKSSQKLQDLNWNSQCPPPKKKEWHPKEQGRLPILFFWEAGHVSEELQYETHPSWGSGLVVVIQPLLNFWRRTRQLLLLRNPGISMQQLWRSPTNWREFSQYLKQFGKVTSYFEYTQSMNSSSCNGCKWMYNKL